MAETQLRTPVLTPRNQQIAQSYVAGLGTMALSKEFNLSQQQICVIKRSALFKLEVQRLEATRPDAGLILGNRLNHVADKGLDVLENLLEINAGNDVTLLKLQGSHAQELLSKAGFGGNANLNVRSLSANTNILTPEEQELIKAQAAALKD